MQVEPIGWTDVHGWTSQGGSLLGTKKYIVKKYFMESIISWEFLKHGLAGPSVKIKLKKKIMRDINDLPFLPDKIFQIVIPMNSIGDACSPQVQ